MDPCRTSKWIEACPKTDHCGMKDIFFRLMIVNGSSASIHPYRRAWIWNQIMMGPHLMSLEAMQLTAVNHQKCTLKRTRVWKVSPLSALLEVVGKFPIAGQNVWRVSNNWQHIHIKDILKCYFIGVNCTDPPDTPSGGSRVWSGRVNDGTTAR